MKKLFSLRFDRLRLVLIIGLIFLLISCGGGTKGTGGDQFIGRVVSPNQEPIAGASVILASTGDSVQTSEDGSFSLVTRFEAGELRILIEKGAVSASVVVGVITPTTKIVKVVIELDEENETAESVETEISEHTQGVSDDS